MRARVAVLLIGLLAASLACGLGRSVPGSPSVSGTGGEWIFITSGCIECHVEGGVAPRLEGLYGDEVRLEGGRTVVADEAYVRQSILSPRAHIVEGYPAVMPDFQARLSADEVEALVGYIRSLAD